MPFRFVHTADLHLDSALRSLALRDPGLSALIGTATRAALVGIVDLCLAEAVDALLIAGDLYDGSQTSMKTARFLAAQMDRLAGAGIPAFIIRGNHDALARITRELVLPPSVRVFGPKAETLILSRPDAPDVAIHGISFRDPLAPDSLLPRFAPPLPGKLNIGMLHSSLNGAAGHDPYAPCALSDLVATGYDYWALGHVHIRAAYPGRTTVVMPGMPQGRDIGEAGPKTVTLVTLADDGTCALAEHAVATAQFDRVAVPLQGLTDWRDLVATLGAALRTARRNSTIPHLVLRPCLTGASPLAWQISRDLDLLTEQARAIAAELGSLWIDKLENLTVPGQGLDLSGPLAALHSLIAPLADDPGLIHAGADAAETLAKFLPRELRNLFGADADTSAALIRQLQSDGMAEILSALQASPSPDLP